MSCIICKLINNEMPSYKVYEDEKVFAFLDINPSSLGHTVVAPKKHKASMSDFSAQELGEIYEKVCEIIQKIKNSEFKPTGFNIGVNQSKSAGQEIDHLHIHIIPRWNNDGGGAIQSVVQNKKQLSLKDVLDKIKKNET